MSTMIQRVQCKRCTAHRDLALTRRCFVCGSDSYDHVVMSAGDLAEAAAAKATAEVLSAAADINQAFLAGLDIAASHPFALRLVDASRNLQASRAAATT